MSKRFDMAPSLLNKTSPRQVRGDVLLGHGKMQSPPSAESPSGRMATRQQAIGQRNIMSKRFDTTRQVWIPKRIYITKRNQMSKRFDIEETSAGALSESCLLMKRSKYEKEFQPSLLIFSLSRRFLLFHILLRDSRLPRRRTRFMVSCCKPGVVAHYLPGPHVKTF